MEEKELARHGNSEQGTREEMRKVSETDWDKKLDRLHLDILYTNGMATRHCIGQLRIGKWKEDLVCKYKN